MDYGQLLLEVAADVRPRIGEGEVAAYIPALAAVPRERFGMALATVGGETAAAGDADEPFSIQSIANVFTLTLAMSVVGERLWQRIGREPSGSRFNSLVSLEYEAGRPRNPFINAGALVVADYILSSVEQPEQALLALVSELCGEAVRFDEQVARSERAWGYRNAALAHFIKSFGKLDNPVERVLDFYVHQCAIAMTCRQLARAAGYLANRGVAPASARPVVSEAQARRLNALMLTCGLYDAAGEFAFNVGIPAKSGVGGGILAVVPGALGMCVWSPGLDASGNSVAGAFALERFVQRSGHSVFEPRGGGLELGAPGTRNE